jgi:hypothetical protein
MTGERGGVHRFPRGTDERQQETEMIAILGIQVVTFVALGALFIAEGQWRLGAAQLLLAAVQAVIYSGKMA